jgi:ethanolamine transporter EutH
MLSSIITSGICDGLAGVTFLIPFLPLVFSPLDFTVSPLSASLHQNVAIKGRTVKAIDLHGRELVTLLLFSWDYFALFTSLLFTGCLGHGLSLIWQRHGVNLTRSSEREAR